MPKYAKFAKEHLNVQIRPKGDLWFDKCQLIENSAQAELGCVQFYVKLSVICTT